MRAAASIIISLVVLSTPALLLAEETRADADLAKENRELRDYIARLEKRLGEMQSKAEQDKRFDLQRRYFEQFNVPRVPPAPFVPPSAPFWYDVPNPFEQHPPQANRLPWRLTPPTTQPLPWRLVPPTTRPAPQRPSTRRSPFFAPHPRFDPAPPPGAERFRFNGQDVYVIPLKPAKP